MDDAAHTEEDPDAETPLFIIASCPVDTRSEGTPLLYGSLDIEIQSGTLAHRIYGAERVSEAFFCSYELNADYRQRIEEAGMIISGKAPDGGTRLVELPDHPFYVGTGFVPHLSSEPGKPHPIITAFVKAAAEANSL